MGLFVFVLLAAGCEHRSEPQPDLSEWDGTWNALDQYLDESDFNNVWNDAATAINTANGNSNANAAAIKEAFKMMLKTDFKSCVIEGDTMKIYNSPDAAGSPTSITYVYAGTHTVEDQEWSKFTGDTDGDFKYLVLGPTHQDSPDAMLHFHLQYSATSFEDATSDPNWVATVVQSGTTIAKIVEDLEGFPWAAFAGYF
jgi:Zn/Cd-binding protein ZinT